MLTTTTPIDFKAGMDQAWRDFIGNVASYFSEGEAAYHEYKIEAAFEKRIYESAERILYPLIAAGAKLDDTGDTIQTILKKIFLDPKNAGAGTETSYGINNNLNALIKYVAHNFTDKEIIRIQALLEEITKKAFENSFKGLDTTTIKNVKNAKGFAENHITSAFLHGEKKATKIELATALAGYTLPFENVAGGDKESEKALPAAKAEKSDSFEYKPRKSTTMGIGASKISVHTTAGTIVNDEYTSPLNNKPSATAKQQTSLASPFLSHLTTKSPVPEVESPKGWCCSPTKRSVHPEKYKTPSASPTHSTP